MNNTQIYTISEIESILRPIFESWSLNKVWLFGSYAKGIANEGSDIDLRIEGGRMKGIFGFGAFYEEIEAALQKSVDIVTSDSVVNSLHKETAEKFTQAVKREELLIYERKG